MLPKRRNQVVLPSPWIKSILLNCLLDTTSQLETLLPDPSQAVPIQDQLVPSNVKVQVWFAWSPKFKLVPLKILPNLKSNSNSSTKAYDRDG